MSKRQIAVYYICNNSLWGHVGAHVWNILQAEGYLKEQTDISFAGKSVMKYTDKNDNEFYFVPMDTAICLDYTRYLPEMNQYFGNADISGMVTWHEGANAPDNILTVHSLGDVNSGVFGAAKPRYMRNLLLAMNRNKQELGLDDYHVVTEATHWSGVYEGQGNPQLLTKYPVAMMDIEVGSNEENWNDLTACRALARSLTQIFVDDGKQVHNLLCVGGVHFEHSFAEAAFSEWDNEALGVTHILANQWLVSGLYEDDNGFKHACTCIDAIEGGIEAIVFHDKLKGCYKDLVRKLGEKYQVPIYKHQKLRNPRELEFIQQDKPLHACNL